MIDRRKQTIDAATQELGALIPKTKAYISSVAAGVCELAGKAADKQRYDPRVTPRENMSIRLNMGSLMGELAGFELRQKRQSEAGRRSRVSVAKAITRLDSVGQPKETVVTSAGRAGSEYVNASNHPFDVDKENWADIGVEDVLACSARQGVRKLFSAWLMANIVDAWSGSQAMGERVYRPDGGRELLMSWRAYAGELDFVDVCAVPVMVGEPHQMLATMSDIVAPEGITVPTANNPLGSPVTLPRRGMIASS